MVGTDQNCHKISKNHTTIILKKQQQNSCKCDKLEKSKISHANTDTYIMKEQEEATNKR